MDGCCTNRRSNVPGIITRNDMAKLSRRQFMRWVTHSFAVAVLYHKTWLPLMLKMPVTNNANRATTRLSLSFPTKFPLVL
jgi:hypothetical protein